MFAPADEALGDVYTQMETLYSLVTESFRFLPVQQSAAATQALLVWEGHTEIPDGDTDACKTLIINADGQAQTGLCGQPETMVAASAEQIPFWSEISMRFAPFEVETPEERLTFQGTGDIASPAWERAVASWARFTYGELVTGRVSASVRTVLHWQFEENADEPGSCDHLIVLSHGYAYVNRGPCEGGNLEPQVEGWLETEELEQLDAWYYGRANYAEGNNYLAGLGDEPMSEAEMVRLAQWAEEVAGRLAE
jgi:hypothetical protein